MKRIIALLIPVILLWSAMSGQKPPSDTALAVIANNSLSVNEMSMKDLQACLLGEKVRWSNKGRVMLALMKSNTLVGKRAAKNVLDKSSTELDKFYLTMVFQGKITSPKTFNNEDELILYVAETPGAIGIINYRQTSIVKFIKIDGKVTLPN